MLRAVETRRGKNSAHLRLGGSFMVASALRHSTLPSASDAGDCMQTAGGSASDVGIGFLNGCQDLSGQFPAALVAAFWNWHHRSPWHLQHAAILFKAELQHVVK